MISRAIAVDISSCSFGCQFDYAHNSDFIVLNVLTFTVISRC